MVSGGMMLEARLQPRQGTQVRSSLIDTDWNSVPNIPAFAIDFFISWPACLMGEIHTMSNFIYLIKHQKGFEYLTGGRVIRIRSKFESWKPVNQWKESIYDHTYPDSKIHGANMGPIWGRQAPVGFHVGPMNFAIWVVMFYSYNTRLSVQNFNVKYNW